jgi:F-type H+-transporting ATPase subunit a
VTGVAYAAAEAAGEAAHGGGGSLPNPMHQFEIRRIFPLELFGFDASFTNSALFMVIAGTIITLFTLLAMRRGALVPGRLQSMAEMSYEFVANMVRDNVGTEGMKYFPFVFTLFMFVLALNMLGLVPYSFTVTSHIIVTFALAAFIFIGVTLIGFWKHGIKFLKFFVPSGVPFVLLPLLVVIEVISYLTRPISLSVRLFANMMAGHTMLKVFGAFVVALGLLGGWAALAFMVAFTGLELLVAFLQAYVFAILTCIYLNDALHMH